ncbi:MAG TPA: PEP-CTERM sorting domain-containing protein [Burkholderiales bacterium]|nr:PEP-CTERM sorting domain-containing protein [Burkholderiales bacterium]
MNLKKLAAATAITFGALASVPASAVILSSYTSAPGNVVTDFSTAGLASFDLDLVSTLPDTTINFTVESADLGGPIAFNAIVRNFFGSGISRFMLFLEDATFAGIGSVDGTFGSVASVSGSGSVAGISFVPPEFVEFSIGDPFLNGATDWSINISNLSAGDTFSLRLAVPEPGSLPLFLVAGLGMAALLRRRASRN